MNGKVLNTRLGNIEYSSIGKGTPVLFVHGGHSNCHETLSHKGFDPEKFQLITPSRPGYGKTSLNGNQTPKQAADLMVLLLNHLEVDRVIVYGISAGGLTAITLAANYPSKVSKLILASAVSKQWLDKDGKTYRTAQLIFRPKVERITWGMVKLFLRILPNMIAKSFYPQFSKKPLHALRADDVKELASALKHYNSGHGFLNDIDQAINSLTITEIKCPTLIIHSRNDSSVTLEHAVHANEMITHAKLVELNNEWGHLFWIGADSITPIKETIAFINE